MTFLGNSVQIGRLDHLLREHGLDRAAHEDFPNDGWSGASLSRLRRGGGQRFILKRDSLERDWIARATGDGPLLREAWFAAQAWLVAENTSDAIRASYLGVGRDGEDFGMLMPDLTGVLFDWGQPISVEALDRVLDGLAAMHAIPWMFHNEASPVSDNVGLPWCPLRERITLISRPSLEKSGPARDAVADRLIPGWDLFDQLAPPAARDLIAMLGQDAQPLVDALEAQPSTLIHGDLKLANVGIGADGVVETVDWQMVSIAPVAVEMGWFLVANVGSLPCSPDEVLQNYATRLRAATDAYHGEFGWDPDPLVDWASQVDAAILVGLLLRGWRKGMDAEAGISLASGVSAADDLAWWCERAIEAADRLF